MRCVRDYDKCANDHIVYNSSENKSISLLPYAATTKPSALKILSSAFNMLMLSAIIHFCLITIKSKTAPQLKMKNLTLKDCQLSQNHAHEHFFMFEQSDYITCKKVLTPPRAKQNIFEDSSIDFNNICYILFCIASCTKKRYPTA